MSDPENDDEARCEGCGEIYKRAELTESEAGLFCDECRRTENDCPSCHGSGGGLPPFRCPACRGTGKRRKCNT